MDEIAVQLYPVGLACGLRPATYGFAPGGPGACRVIGRSYLAPIPLGSEGRGLAAADPPVSDGEPVACRTPPGCSVRRVIGRSWPRADPARCALSGLSYEQPSNCG